MNIDMISTLGLFVNASKFSLKLSISTSNFYVLLHALRVIETNMLRAPSPSTLFENLYEPLLSFLVKSASCSDEWETDSPALMSQHVAKQINIRKFFLALYLHLFKFSYSHREVLGDQSLLIDKYLVHLKECFNNGS